MKNYKSAFSLIEIILGISLLIIISVVAMTSYGSIQEKSQNVIVQTNIKTLDNGLSLYQEENKLYPYPDGNLRYYGAGGDYKHINFDDDIFGVSGYITNTTLDKKYMDTLPLDPRTHQYYAYGVTSHQKGFQVAGITKKYDTPQTLVFGNYSSSTHTGLNNLVKEYIGPEFVNDKSQKYFPYNPQERQLVAQIKSYSGQIQLNGKNYSDEEIKKYVLSEGDRIFVSTGGQVNMYYSDGSESILGDSVLFTDVILANMKYQSENNLLTDIKIALNMGQILNKVSKLIQGSEFEVYTVNSIASVRGTIFIVRYDGSKTTLQVNQGKVEIKKNDIGVSTIEDLVKIIQTKNGGNLQESELFGTSFTGEELQDMGIQFENAVSLVEVKKGENPKGINIDGGINENPIISQSSNLIPSNDTPLPDNPPDDLPDCTQYITEVEQIQSISGTLTELNCLDNSLVGEWYKFMGRCGEQSGIDYRNDKLDEANSDENNSTNTESIFESFQITYYYNCDRDFGTRDLKQCNNKIICGSEPGTEYVMNTNQCVIKSCDISAMVPLLHNPIRKEGAWGSCIGGSQTRTIECKDNLGNTIHDDFCRSSSKPNDQQNCMIPFQKNQLISFKTGSYSDTLSSPSIIDGYKKVDIGYIQETASQKKEVFVKLMIGSTLDYSQLPKGAMVGILYLEANSDGTIVNPQMSLPYTLDWMPSVNDSNFSDILTPLFTGTNCPSPDFSRIGIGFKKISNGGNSKYYQVYTCIKTTGNVSENIPSGTPLGIMYRVSNERFTDEETYSSGTIFGEPAINRLPSPFSTINGECDGNFTKKQIGIRPEKTADGIQKYYKIYTCVKK